MNRHRRVMVGEIEATFEAWAHDKNVPVAIIIYDDGCVKCHTLNELNFVVNRRHHWEIIEEAKKYPWYDIYFTASYLNQWVYVERDEVTFNPELSFSLRYEGVEMCRSQGTGPDCSMKNY